MADPTAPAPGPAELASTRRRMERLAWLLDGAVPVPGTSFRFGVDSIIGLIPGVGDVIGLALGAAILYEAIRIGAPRDLVGRMVGNTAADAVLGVVPVLGDVMDFAFKSNQRNAKLLMAHLDAIEGKPATPTRRGSGLVALLVVVALVAAIAGLVVLAWRTL
ncbi:MAG TPA: DUF4112 domain-containing protein [Nevskiaceae bacterium]|nr:DUF4112 domain-containing protein [Nevskiaceae bacterium]